MYKLERRIPGLVASVVAAACLLTAGGLAAQEASEPEKQPPAQEEEPAPPAPARRSGPYLTGTVVDWNGDRMDLRTAEGKTQKVAVNQDTELLVEIVVGAEVRVEYRRKISGFVIAERVLPGGEAAPAEPSASATGQKPSTVTGSVLSWNDAALLLRTAEGEVTLYLSPTTEYLVESLDPGLRVTVDYREGSDRAKVALRVRPAEAEDAAAKENDSG